MDQVRVLIVDDHPAFREGVRAVLAAEPSMEAVGEAATGVEGGGLSCRASARCRRDGLADARAQRRRGHATDIGTSPHIAVLILTMSGDNESVFAAMREGTRDYLLKESSPEQITVAVRALSCGETIFGPAVAKRVVEYFAQPQLRPADAAFPQLTDREREVLGMIASGHNNALIARRLYLSVKTVRNHVSNIFTKLQVADRAQAIVRAREAGFETLPPNR